MGEESRLKARDIYDATHLMRRYQCGLTREKCAMLGRICDSLFEQEEQWAERFDQDEVLSVDLFDTIREAFTKTTSWRKWGMDSSEEFKPVEGEEALSKVEIGGSYSTAGGQPTDIRRRDDWNGTAGAGASSSNADRGRNSRNRPGRGAGQGNRTWNGAGERTARPIDGKQVSLDQVCEARPCAGATRSMEDATMREQDPDLKGLQSFANQTDREESPIFVGREREIEHVVRQAEVVGEVHAEGRDTQGATIVITGCPGSGKSAFLGHFARAFEKHELTKTVLIPVRCSDLDLTARNTEDLETQIARHAVRREERLHKTFQALLKDAGQALKLRNTFERLEQKISSDAGKRTVVCLLVDEIQNVTEASAPAVQLLHTRAFSPPVLPIYAGLDDSVDKLEKVCAISRLAANARMTMGKLPEHAATEAADLLFEKYRVRSDAGTRAAWAQAIDKEALGFAQHLHVALQAACAVLVARGGTARAEDAGRGEDPRTHGERTVLRVEDQRHSARARRGGARRGAPSDAHEHATDGEAPGQVGQEVDAQTRPSVGRVQQRGSARTDRTHAPPGDPAPHGTGPGGSGRFRRCTPGSPVPTHGMSGWQPARGGKKHDAGTRGEH